MPCVSFQELTEEEEEKRKKRRPTENIIPMRFIMDFCGFIITRISISKLPDPVSEAVQQKLTVRPPHCPACDSVNRPGEWPTGDLLKGKLDFQYMKGEPSLLLQGKVETEASCEKDPEFPFDFEVGSTARMLLVLYWGGWDREGSRGSILTFRRWNFN